MISVIVKLDMGWGGDKAELQSNVGTSENESSMNQVLRNKSVVNQVYERQYNLGRGG